MPEEPVSPEPLNRPGGSGPTRLDVPFGLPGPQRLLIVAPDEFMPALQPLVDFKNASGMSAVAVSISSLAPLFAGVDDPETIKNAIRYAHERLHTSYVMLVGDAHWFPVRFRFMHGLTVNYPGSNVAVPADGDYIPADLYYANLYHHTGVYPNLEPGSFDNWDENGNGLYNEGTWLDLAPTTTSNPDNVDGYPDVAVGRIPAHSIQDVESYVSKVMVYEAAPAEASFFTFVADAQYGGSTQDTAGIVGNSGVLAGLLPSQAHYLLIENQPGGATPPGWINAAATDVAAYSGLSTWVSYVGHGGSEVWGYYGVFSEANVLQTSGSKSLPIVFAAGCMTGRFIPDLPWNGEYVDDAGNQHLIEVVPTAKPNVDGPVFVDHITGETWGTNCPPPGCTSPLPMIAPRPAAYDFDRSDLCFAYPWLISSAPGGAIAYYGEIGTANDNMGSELQTHLLSAYAAASTPTAQTRPVLGDLILKAQQQYWANHNTNVIAYADYDSVARFWLGLDVFYGDPSLRLPALTKLKPEKLPGLEQKIIGAGPMQTQADALASIRSQPFQAPK